MAIRGRRPRALGSARSEVVVSGRPSGERGSVSATASEQEARTRDPRPRRFGRDRLLFIALFVLAVLVPIAVTVSRVQPRVVAEPSLGDSAAEELAVIEAAHGARTLGQWSRYDFFQPGPLLFYAMVPAYALTADRAWGLGLGVFLISWASILAVCALCSRRLAPWSGAFLAAPALGGVLLYLQTSGHSVLFNPWNNFPVVLPAAALLLFAACAACGEARSWPWLLLLASFVAQTQAAILPTALAVVVLAGVFYWRARPAGGGERSRGALAASAMTAVVAWFPTLVETIRHPHGNLARMAAFAFGPAERHAAREVFPWWAQAFSGSMTSFFAHARWDTQQSPRQVAAAESLAIALLLALAPAFWSARRRGRAVSAALCLVAATAALVSFWSMTREHGGLLPHPTLWVVAVGAVTFLAVVNEAIAALRDALASSGRATPQARRRGWCLAAALAPAALLVADPSPQTYPQAQVLPMTHQLLAWLDHRVTSRAAGERPSVRLISDDATWIWTASIAAEMTRSGRRPCFSHLLWTSPWWECDATVERSVRLYEPARSAARGRTLFCAEMAGAGMFGVFRLCAEDVS